MTEVKTVFAAAFQHIFAISLGFVVVAFLICWFLGKGVLSKRDPDPIPDSTLPDWM
ncbi:MAG: family efflux transporter permease subunit [Paenibacillaceae bacterium]|nr:family efflux transporter permease subunit [Paenibacillaceae bacterium]